MKWIRILIEKETNTVSILMMKIFFKKIKKINWQLNINANDLLHIYLQVLKQVFLYVI